MIKSLKIIAENPFPIQVTNYHFMGELESWIDHFQKKEIEIDLRPNGKGRFAVFRKATPEEIAEIKARKVIIRLGSFKEIRPGDHL
ncbi:MAG: hypothetical protein ABIG69_04095 [Bacteroidota bacterium]